MFLEIWLHLSQKPEFKDVVAGVPDRIRDPGIWFVLRESEGSVMRARFVESECDFDKASTFLRPKLGLYLLDILNDIQLGNVYGTERGNGIIVERWIAADERFPSLETMRCRISIDLSERLLGEVLEELCPNLSCI